MLAGQLQILLDKAYPGKYVVTNLGACGSTMMKGADSPYWQRPQYAAFTHGAWDIVIIMLGTNDAKDAGSGGPHNWPHNCTGSRMLDCPYAADYRSLISVARGLGRAGGTPPEVLVAIPPPLMRDGAYGMNQTVINDVLPALVPAIANSQPEAVTTIDVFTAMGGISTWRSTFPAAGCTADHSKSAKCGFFCDSQSCDQCHPDDVGYHAMAQAVKEGLGL